MNTDRENREEEKEGAEALRAWKRATEVLEEVEEFIGPGGEKLRRAVSELLKAGEEATEALAAETSDRARGLLSYATSERCSTSTAYAAIAGIEHAAEEIGEFQKDYKDTEIAEETVPGYRKALKSAKEAETIARSWCRVYRNPDEEGATLAAAEAEELIKSFMEYREHVWNLDACRDEMNKSMKRKREEAEEKRKEQKRSKWRHVQLLLAMMFGAVLRELFGAIRMTISGGG